MARPAPRLTLGQVQQVASLLVSLSNINWKGFKPVIDKIKALWARLDLKDYWGRLLLIGAAAILIGFVLFDWRSQAVGRVEARAELAQVTAERDTLALQVMGNAAASAERQRILLLMEEHNQESMDDLQESIQANPDWANQPIPDDLRRRLPNHSASR
jgi:hypothetical protein